MSQSFPTTVPNYPDTAGSEVLGSLGGGKGLSPILDDYGLDLIAVATKLGTGDSSASSGTVLRATGNGESEWGAVDLAADVTGTLPVANGGTGATTSTGTGAVVRATSPTIVTPAIVSFANATHNHQNNAGGSVLDDRAVKLRNDGPLQARNAAAALVDVLKLGTDDYLRLSQLPYQANTTNSTRTGVVVQHGWGFIVGDGTNPYTSETVTFPKAFSSAPVILATYIGWRSTGTTPDGTEDFTNSHHTGGVMAITTSAASTTSFNVQLRLYTTIPTNQQQGYSWIAIGPA